MDKLVISSHNDFEAYLGKDLGESHYLTISQEQINQFADATLDHQWIHTDPERASRESAFNSTIAHGYLTLSLLPYLWEQIADIRNIKMMINYEIESLRFNQPVLVNSQVRLRAKLDSLADLRGITKCNLGIVLEIKGNKKPALSGNLIFLYHFIA